MNNVGSAQQGAPTDTRPEIRRMAQRLGEAGQDLLATCARLEEQLSPVLREELVTAGQVSEVEKLETPLGRELCSIGDDVTLAQARFERLLNLLEL